MYNIFCTDYTAWSYRLQPSWMVPAVLVFLFCCWPLGLIAINAASNVNIKQWSYFIVHTSSKPSFIIKNRFRLVLTLYFQIGAKTFYFKLFLIISFLITGKCSSTLWGCNRSRKTIKTSAHLCDCFRDCRNYRYNPLCCVSCITISIKVLKNKLRSSYSILYLLLDVKLKRSKKCFAY